MKLGQHRMNKESIKEAIEMRRQGYSSIEIGKFFGKDHTTILYHCQKAGITQIRTQKKRPKILHIEVGDRAERISNPDDDGEVINPSKSYKDYVAEEKARNWKKRSDIARSPID